MITVINRNIIRFSHATISKPNPYLNIIPQYNHCTCKVFAYQLESSVLRNVNFNVRDDIDRDYVGSVAEMVETGM